MSDPASEIRSEYADALAEYLAQGQELQLRHAYELGRKAIASTLGVLDIVNIHHEAMERNQRRNGGAGWNDGETGRSHEFLLEALSQFEVVHRGFQELITALRRLNEALERESRRIAHSLHDNAGPLLVQAHLALHALRSVVTEEQWPALNEARQRLNDLEEWLRQTSHELRPRILEEKGLTAALRVLADGVSLRAGIPVEVEIDDSIASTNATAEAAVFRVVQEALTNVGRHARATRGWISIRLEDGTLRGVVADNGVGLTPPGARRSAVGLGLLGVRERLNGVGGMLDIAPRPGGGTVLKFAVPWQER